MLRLLVEIERPSSPIVKLEWNLNYFQTFKYLTNVKLSNHKMLFISNVQTLLDKQIDKKKQMVIYFSNASPASICFHHHNHQSP